MSVQVDGRLFDRGEAGVLVGDRDVAQGKDGRIVPDRRRGLFLRRRFLGSGSRTLFEVEHCRQSVLPIERGMEVSGEGADGLEIFGREEEHRERRGERDAAIDQMEAEHDRDGGDASGRDEVEHGTRKRGDLERVDRRAAECLACLEDLDPARPSGAEGLDGRQPPQRVDEMVGHRLERAVLALRLILRHVSDQDHEEDDDGEQHEQDERRNDIERNRSDEDDQGNHDDADHFGQHELEIRFDLRGSFDERLCDGGRACLLLQTRVARERPFHQPLANLVHARARERFHAGIRYPGNGLGCKEACGEDGDGQGLIGYGISVPDACDGRREPPCLSEHAERMREGGDEKHDERAPDGGQGEKSLIEHRPAFYRGGDAARPGSIFAVRLAEDAYGRMRRWNAPFGLVDRRRFLRFACGAGIPFGAFPCMCIVARCIAYAF